MWDTKEAWPITNYVNGPGSPKLLELTPEASASQAVSGRANL
ncbi:hypothetical protein FH603_3351 [Spirosoma sp. LMG 31447]|uniref:Uncharacterized protein n=1 Tax=Spirosoma utsteinense TaxID=2585773 RepID=A0ABR6WA64_9BACT|nr:hypothetical protein [Spirosoma utsteinense]